MSQLRIIVLCICIKWSMTSIITIIGAPLVVARHRVFPFIEYHDENRHSIIDLSNMWLPKRLTRYATWFLASMIITQYDFKTKFLTLWARRKALQVYLDFVFFFVEDHPNSVFIYTNGMWHDLWTIFDEIVLSKKISLELKHYIEYSYIPMFALVYTLELLQLQLLKCSLASRFC